MLIISSATNHFNWLFLAAFQRAVPFQAKLHRPNGIMISGLRRNSSVGSIMRGYDDTCIISLFFLSFFLDLKDPLR